MLSYRRIEQEKSFCGYSLSKNKWILRDLILKAIRTAISRGCYLNVYLFVNEKIVMNFDQKLLELNKFYHIISWKLIKSLLIKFFKNFNKRIFQSWLIGLL